jgi:uncharacterized membrane protein
MKDKAAEILQNIVIFAILPFIVILFVSMGIAYMVFCVILIIVDVSAVAWDKLRRVLCGR